jgi:TRAP-type C4-dicarboxylate transport system substrate-binding protein
MNRSRLAGTLVVGLLLFSIQSVFGLTLKIATVTPEQSPWGHALNRISAELARETNGSLRLQVFHNGIAGEEGDMLRKMRIGQLDGGVFTSVGLNKLADEVMTLSVPLLIRDDGELDFVFGELRDRLAAAAQRNRFRVLAWSKAGWIRFFSESRVETPADLKELTLAVSAEDAEVPQAFRLMGYQAVPMPSNELLTSLNSGVVDAFYASPIAAAGYQWFGAAPYMLDLRISPFLGGFVVSERSWRRIPPDARRALETIVAREAQPLDSDVRELEQRAIETMRSYDLEVVELSEAQRERWFSEFEESAEVSVGRVFDSEMYQTIRALLRDYRR